MGRQAKIKRARRNLRALLRDHRAAITDPSVSDADRTEALRHMGAAALSQYVKDVS